MLLDLQKREKERTWQRRGRWRSQFLSVRVTEGHHRSSSLIVGHFLDPPPPPPLPRFPPALAEAHSLSCGKWAALSTDACSLGVWCHGASVAAVVIGFHAPHRWSLASQNGLSHPPRNNAGEKFGINCVRITVLWKRRETVFFHREKKKTILRVSIILFLSRLPVESKWLLKCLSLSNQI